MLIKNGETKPMIEIHPTVDGAVIWTQVKGNIQDIAAEVNKTIGTAQWELKIEKVKKKKTLDQVGYAWVLIDKLAAALKDSPKNVYRELVRDIAGVSDMVCVMDAAVDDFIKGWESRGIGWQTEKMPSKLAGCTNIKIYYGMSCYDRTQMTTLIDRIVEECKSQGIPTMTPREIAELEGMK